MMLVVGWRRRSQIKMLNVLRAYGSNSNKKQIQEKIIMSYSYL